MLEKRGFGVRLKGRQEDLELSNEVMGSHQGIVSRSDVVTADFRIRSPVAVGRGGLGQGEQADGCCSDRAAGGWVTG